jgi:hypothetical protein
MDSIETAQPLLNIRNRTENRRSVIVSGELCKFELARESQLYININLEMICEDML